jgi:hypothetical protein
MAGSWARRCALLATLLACAGATASAAAASAAASSRPSHNKSWHKPGFCGRMDCPKFTIWQKSPEFQLREYKPGEVLPAAGRQHAAVPVGPGCRLRTASCLSDGRACNCPARPCLRMQTWDSSRAQSQPLCVPNVFLACPPARPPACLPTCLPAAYWVATNVSEVEYETAVKRAGKAG